MIGGYGSAVQGSYCARAKGHTVAKINAQWEAGQRVFFAHAPFQVRVVQTLVGAFFALQPIKDTYARAL